MLHSARTAAATGRPFTVAVSITTFLLGIPETDVSERFRKMRRLRFVRWSTYTPKGSGRMRNSCPADTWQIEAPDGFHHIHWMLHIRPENRVQFERKLEKWVKAMAGMQPDDPLPPGALVVYDLHNPEGKKLYMAKGIDPFYARLFRIKAVDCGAVHGIRGGTARSLGPSVWKPLKNAYKASKAIQ